jgi:hypothetical protein
MVGGQSRLWMARRRITSLMQETAEMPMSAGTPQLFSRIPGLIKLLHLNNLKFCKISAELQNELISFLFSKEDICMNSKYIVSGSKPGSGNGQTSNHELWLGSSQYSRRRVQR